ncbi:(d)CMP kinase [bacterium]|nr:(d)CMP kinase [bacterium]
MNYQAIAIDGPAGSGKSTVAKIIAKKLGFTYIDTGAMYRAITLKALNLKIKDLGDENNYTFIKDTTLDFVDSKMTMDGIDVSKEIRTEEIVKNVSLVSSLKYVRVALVDLQRQMAKRCNVVMDGRDIGTNVLTDADLKIYLTATVDVRAERRYLEQKEKGISNMTFEEVKADLIRRDTYDSTRKHNPLRKADDAIELDTSGLSIEEVVNKITHLFKELSHE